MRGYHRFKRGLLHENNDVLRWLKGSPGLSAYKMRFTLCYLNEYFYSLVTLSFKLLLTVKKISLLSEGNTMVVFFSTMVVRFPLSLSQSLDRKSSLDWKPQENFQLFFFGQTVQLPPESRTCQQVWILSFFYCRWVITKVVKPWDDVQSRGIFLDSCWPDRTAQQNHTSHAGLSGRVGNSAGSGTQSDPVCFG